MSVVANVAINVDSRNAVSKLREVQSQATATERAIGGLGGAIGKLAAAFSVIQAAKFVFVSTAEIESQTRSLQVLTGSAEKAGQIIKELQQLGAVTPFTSSELIDSAKRLQAFGVESDKVVDTTRRLADVSGATGAELQGLVTAYGQVQAKGRLQGEELLQFQERGVALQQELRKQYNLSGEEFQDALSKGKISAEAVEFAIQSLTNAGGKYANGAIAQSDTLNGRLSTLQDGIEGLARSIGAALTPAIKAVLNEAIFAVNTINQLIATGARAKSFGLDQRGRQQILKQAQQEAQDIVNLRNIRDPFERNRQFQELAAQRERDLIEAFGIRTGQVKPQVTASQAQRTLPPLGAGTAGAGRKGKSDAEKAAEKAAREAERLAELTKNQLDSAQQNYALAEAGLAVSAAVTDNEKLQAEYEKQRAERMFKYSELLKNALSDKEREFIVVTQEYEIQKAQLDLNKNLYDITLKQSELLNQQTPLAAAQQEIELLAAKIQGKEQEYLLQKQINELILQGVSPEDAQGVVLTIKDLEKQNKVIQDQKQLWADIYTTVSGELQNALTGLIDGTTKWGDVLSSILGNLGNLFLNAAFSGLGGALKLPGFANGGFVTGPTTAMIGEGGESEYVIPASKMRAAMGRYAGGARGAAVIPGNGESGGGGMGPAPSGTIDVRYSIERINNVNYVTADQFQRGMAQAAQQGAIQGERRAMRSLKNSAATRRGVGI